MIEVLPDMPEGVTGIRVSGRVRGDDLREFKPDMEEMLKTGELRIVEVIASDNEGSGPAGWSRTSSWASALSSGVIRPLSESRSCPIRNGLPIPCMRWGGWSPASSPFSDSTSSSVPRSGPRAEGAGQSG